MASVVLSGYGPRYNKILKMLPSQFYRMDIDNDILKVHFGDNPDKDTKVWIRGTSLKSMTELGNQIKKEIDQNKNLDMIIIEEFSPNIYLPSFHVLITRDNVITTFQKSEDLNNFLINKFNSHMEI